MLAGGVRNMLPLDRFDNGFIGKGSLMSILISVRYIFLVAILSFTGIALSACEEEGAAEKFGKSIDKGVDDMKDAIDDATD